MVIFNNYVSHYQSVSIRLLDLWGYGAMGPLRIPTCQVSTSSGEKQVSAAVVLAASFTMCSRHLGHPSVQRMRRSWHEKKTSGKVNISNIMQHHYGKSQFLNGKNSLFLWHLHLHEISRSGTEEQQPEVSGDALRRSACVAGKKAQHDGCSTVVRCDGWYTTT